MSAKDSFDALDDVTDQQAAAILVLADAVCNIAKALNNMDDMICRALVEAFKQADISVDATVAGHIGDMDSVE